jgi:hypothetical protein
MTLYQKFTIPLAAFALIAAGAATTVAYQSHAQTITDTSQQGAQVQQDNEQDQQGAQIQQSNDQEQQFDQIRMEGHMDQNGTKEEQLSGDTADMIKQDGPHHSRDQDR